MSFAGSSLGAPLARTPWIASFILTAACTGVVGMPTAAQQAENATSDGGEATPRTDIEVDPSGTTRGDGGPARADGGTVRRDGGSKPASQRSAGCGKSATGTGSFERRTVRIGDRERIYHVFVPSGYDPTRAHALVFRFHGSGGDGRAGGLDIEYQTGNDAIVVGADGVNRQWSGGTQADDLQLFDTMLATLSESHCIDTTRVFAYGFSMGAGFTNLLGCVRADKLRGIAAIAGFNRIDARCDQQPMAAWFQHDQGDPAVNISIGRAARDRVLDRNDCAKDETTSADGCTTYTGCDAGEPVVWCETTGLAHDIDGSRAPKKVWSFFSTLP